MRQIGHTSVMVDGLWLEPLIWMMWRWLERENNEQNNWRTNWWKVWWKHRWMDELKQKLSDKVTEWPTVWLTDQPFDQPTNPPVDRPIDRPTDQPTDQLTDRLSILLSPIDGISRPKWSAFQSFSSMLSVILIQCRKLQMPWRCLGFDGAFSPVFPIVVSLSFSAYD